MVMNMSEQQVQENINKIWKEKWEMARGLSLREIFSSRIFPEAFPVIKKYIPSKFNNLLDVGCGTGKYGLRLAQDFSKSSITISDILDEALSIPRRLAVEAGIENVSFQKDDILASAFPNDHFDVVFSDLVIQHLHDYRKAIQEIRRITKPGGRIVIAVVNFWNFHTLYKRFLTLTGRKYVYGYEKSFSRQELKEVMEKENIRIIATDGFYVGYGIFRLRNHHQFFSLLGRVVNRISKILDKYTNRFFSRNFGFEIVIVG
ncbi:MAG: hypothetical protein US30_C0025G0001, partial [Candidatus Moranbacteria bacterium GW2011_GWF2_36_839]